MKCAHLTIILNLLDLPISKIAIKLSAHTLKPAKVDVGTCSRVIDIHNITIMLWLYGVMFNNNKLL